MVGLIYGLVFVRLDWTNEAQVIKNGFAIILTMVTSAIIGILSAIGLAVGLVIGTDPVLYSVLGGEIVIIGGLCFGAYAIITHYGVKKYESLNG